MRIQVIALICLFSVNAYSATDKEMNQLFTKYDEVMKQHKVELIEEVFTSSFIEEQGGKEEFAAKVKSVPAEKKKTALGRLFAKWKQSKVGKFFLTKRKNDHGKDTEFIVKEENGKLKIDGTISDG